MKQYAIRMGCRLAMLAAMLGTVLGAQGGFGASPAQAATWTAGGFTTSATVAPIVVSPGSTVTVTASVTSIAAATVLVDMEIYNAGGTQVMQRALDGQVFGAGEQKSLPVDWNVPAGLAAGVYTVRIGIFSVGWGTLYHWNDSAALLSVGGTPTPPPGGALPRVMPLGDSLTDGYNIPGGYRVDLWSLLAAESLSIDFVGSLSNGPANLPDHDHEGHSGWRIDQIAGGVVEWLTLAQPDVVLLMIGTNDMGQDFNVATAPDRLSALIDQITTTVPAANVVVASIPRMGYGSSPLLDRVQAYNATIPGIVAAKVGQGKHVSYADVFAVIQESDLYDGVHMVASGNQKMAQVWHTALKPLISPGSPATSTPTATSTSTPTSATATPIPATATATRTPTPGMTQTPGGTQTVPFDDLPGQDRLLEGQYPSGIIDWGTGSWFLSGPWGAFTTKSVSFTSAAQRSATFTFVTPRRLISLQAFNGGAAATLTLSCPGQPDSQTALGAGQVATVQTGWTVACASVTVGSTNGWNTNLDAFVVDGSPVATSTPLGATATATATRTTTPVAATATATRTPTPIAATATATRTSTPAGATATATRTPTPVTATATATIGSGAAQTVTFDDRTGQNQALNGQYPNGVIDWGSGRWYHSAPWGAFTTKSASFLGGGQTSAVFTFVAPRRLVSLRAYNGSGGAATVTLACAGQPTATATLSAGQVTTIATGWSGTCAAVTVTSTAGWDVNFDDLVHDGG